MLSRYPFIFSTLLIASSPLFAAENRATLADQESVAVTIYNENLALVKDKRNLTIPTGVSQLAFRGVSAQMRSETALLRSLDNRDALHVLEQNFDYDLLTPTKLLDKYVGKQIKIARQNPATGTEIIETATVLSTQQGLVVKIGDRIETNPQGRFIFESVPDNLRDKPTLVTQISNKVAKQQMVELSYLTGGLSWKADYVAELSADEKTLDLAGWITLNNRSGTAYQNAQLQLVAGDVNQVQPQMQQGRYKAAAPMMMEMAADGAVSEESLFEYHLYNLNRPTDLADNQTKQVALLSATSVPVRKELLLQGANYYYRSQYNNIGQKLKFAVFVAFDNSEATKLGLPLPKGVVRVYKNDSAGKAQFIGEDRIDHTAKNDEVRLKLGNSFDVTANKVQTKFDKLHHSPKYSAAYHTGFEVTINNGKSEQVTVTIREPIPGAWQITSSSHDHTKVSSHQAEWEITIPAESKQTLRYEVDVKF